MDPDDELDPRALVKEDWWQVCQELRPDITRPEFELMWRDFCRAKEVLEMLKSSGPRLDRL